MEDKLEFRLFVHFVKSRSQTRSINCNVLTALHLSPKLVEGFLLGVLPARSRLVGTRREDVGALAAGEGGGVRPPLPRTQQYRYVLLYSTVNKSNGGGTNKNRPCMHGTQS
jgi:hypothetical protein